VLVPRFSLLWACSSSPQALGRDLLVHDTEGMLTARLSRRVVLAATIAGLGLGPGLLGPPVHTSADAQPVAARYRVLVFSRTAGFRHDSIPDAIAAVRTLGDQNSFLVDATEDPSVFTDSVLAGYGAVIFLLTTGHVLDNSQQAAFERYIAAGNGFVGVHSAADTEYDWSWYGGLLGAYFASHPDIQPAVVHREDANHPSTVSLPDVWVRTDEWYNFQTNPRDTPDIHVLASLDESSYSGGTMGDHPIAWYQEYAGGRAWYTAGGHTRESYSEPLFLQHVLGGLEYAAGGPDTFMVR
jgi:type 1 glutamine amidotransferase